MTVPTTSNRQDFTVSGAGPIGFNHRLDAPGDLQLWVRDADGFKQFQATLNVDYTVSIALDFFSANVTLLEPFLTVYAGRNCSLLRELPLTQDANVEQVQRFSDGELEKAYDRGAMRDQQLVERLNETELKLLEAIEDTNNMSAAASAAAAAASAAAAAASAAAADASADIATAAEAVAPTLHFYWAFVGGL